MNVEPNWFVQVVVGVILGLLSPVIIRMVFLPFRYFNNHVLKRNWWEYHYSVKGEISQVFEANITIKVGFKGALVCKMKQETTNLKYKGSVIFETGTDQFIISGNSTDSHNEEYMYWRFYLPLQSNAETIKGIVTSYTHDKKPYSSTAILSKEKLSLDQAEKMLKSIAIYTNDFPLLRVKSTQTSLR